MRGGGVEKTASATGIGHPGQREEGATRENEMGLVTSLFVRKVVRAMGDAIDATAMLRSVGLDPTAETDVAQMVVDTAYYDLLERIAAETGGAVDLPIRAGRSMACDDYGAFGLAWKTAPTLRGSFARAERYWRLLTTVAEYEVRADGENAYFILHREGERRLGLRLSNEATLASVTSIIREVSPAPFSPLEAHFKHPAPPDARAHAAYFGCPLVFASEMDALLIPGQALNRANRLGDEGVSRFMVEHLDAELKKRAADDWTLARMVRSAVAQSLSDGMPRSAEVARRLGMSERTLQRRLGEEGLSFQRIAEGARRELAEGLLAQSDYSLAEVAFLTGFSEQSAFTRAFKRWSDQTPAAYRETARGR